ncbi:MAG: Gfo/Idh/MocA family oxidoreductase [Planctomycetes bacterium]|nr:Gfo/Idh/MocA family oxidoreductase [Planctomycetota bacterium]
MTGSSRRSFLASVSSATAAMAAGSVSSLAAASGVHVQGSDRLRVGIVGCGGRGSGAVLQALNAHPENVLVAMGDAFINRLEGSLDSLVESLGVDRAKKQVDVPPERRFVGLDSIDKVLAAGVDVILLTSPPGFRPDHIEKAVAAGVHIFAEKPVATDSPGVRRVMAACEVARQKKLNVVSGLCYRYHEGRRAIVQRLQEGAVGEILAIQGDYITGGLWSFKREDGWSELEWQMRNWLYYTWLSGDHIAEQHIHTLDVMAWIKKDVYPIAAVSLGGRQSRTDAIYGEVFDHFATIYEWADGTRGYAYCRQQNDCWRNANELVLGTEGRAKVFDHQITGKNAWKHTDPIGDMYQNEHDALFAAVRGGKRIDNADYMCKSTLMAIQGRMAGYTGRRVTWDEALQNNEVLVPEKLAFDMPVPPPVVARPGITRIAGLGEKPKNG